MMQINNRTTNDSGSSSSNSSSQTIEDRIHELIENEHYQEAAELLKKLSSSEQQTFFNNLEDPAQQAALLNNLEAPVAAGLLIGLDNPEQSKKILTELWNLPNQKGENQVTQIISNMASTADGLNSLTEILKLTEVADSKNWLFDLPPSDTGKILNALYNDSSANAASNAASKATELLQAIYDLNKDSPYHQNKVAQILLSPGFEADNATKALLALPPDIREDVYAKLVNNFTDGADSTKVLNITISLSTTVEGQSFLAEMFSKTDPETGNLLIDSDFVFEFFRSAETDNAAKILFNMAPPAVAELINEWGNTSSANILNHDILKAIFVAVVDQYSDEGLTKLVEIFNQENLEIQAGSDLLQLLAEENTALVAKILYRIKPEIAAELMNSWNFEDPTSLNQLKEIVLQILNYDDGAEKIGAIFNQTELSIVNAAILLNDLPQDQAYAIVLNTNADRIALMFDSDKVSLENQALILNMLMQNNDYEKTSDIINNLIVIDEETGKPTEQSLQKIAQIFEHDNMTPENIANFFASDYITSEIAGGILYELARSEINNRSDNGDTNSKAADVLKTLYALHRQKTYEIANKIISTNNKRALAETERGYGVMAEIFAQMGESSADEISNILKGIRDISENPAQDTKAKLVLGYLNRHYPTLGEAIIDADNITTPFEFKSMTPEQQDAYLKELIENGNAEKAAELFLNLTPGKQQQLMETMDIKDFATLVTEGMTAQDAAEFFSDIKDQPILLDIINTMYSFGESGAKKLADIFSKTDIISPEVTGKILDDYINRFIIAGKQHVADIIKFMDPAAGAEAFENIAIENAAYIIKLLHDNPYDRAMYLFPLLEQMDSEKLADTFSEIITTLGSDAASELIYNMLTNSDGRYTTTIAALFDAWDTEKLDQLSNIIINVYQKEDGPELINEVLNHEALTPESKGAIFSNLITNDDQGIEIVWPHIEDMNEDDLAAMLANMDTEVANVIILEFFSAGETDKVRTIFSKMVQLNNESGENYGAAAAAALLNAVAQDNIGWAAEILESSDEFPPEYQATMLEAWSEDDLDTLVTILQEVRADDLATLFSESNLSTGRAATLLNRLAATEDGPAFVAEIVDEMTSTQEGIERIAAIFHHENMDAKTIADILNDPRFVEGKHADILYAMLQISVDSNVVPSPLDKVTQVFDELVKLNEGNILKPAELLKNIIDSYSDRNEGITAAAEILAKMMASNARELLENLGDDYYHEIAKALPDGKLIEILGSDGNISTIDFLSLSVEQQITYISSLIEDGLHEKAWELLNASNLDPDNKQKIIESLGSKNSSQTSGNYSNQLEELIYENFNNNIDEIANYFEALLQGDETAIKNAAAMLSLLPPASAANIMNQIDSDSLVNLIPHIEAQPLAQIFIHMGSDEVADLFNSAIKSAGQNTDHDLRMKISSIVIALSEMESDSSDAPNGIQKLAEIFEHLNDNSLDQILHSLYSKGNANIIAQVLNEANNETALRALLIIDQSYAAGIITEMWELGGTAREKLLEMFSELNDESDGFGSYKKLAILFTELEDSLAAILFDQLHNMSKNELFIDLIKTNDGAKKAARIIIKLPSEDFDYKFTIQPSYPPINDMARFLNALADDTEDGADIIAEVVQTIRDNLSEKDPEYLKNLILSADLTDAARNAALDGFEEIDEKFYEIFDLLTDEQKSAYVTYLREYDKNDRAEVLEDRVSKAP